MFSRTTKIQSLTLRHNLLHLRNATDRNDSTRGRRRLADQPPSQRVLVCRWVLTRKGRLECRWSVESFDQTSGEDSDGCRATRKMATDSTSCPHALSFSAEAIGHSRSSSGPGCVTLLHRALFRNLQKVALTVRA